MEIAEPEVPPSEEQSALDLLEPDPVDVPQSSSAGKISKDEMKTEPAAEISEVKSALDLLEPAAASVSLEPETCDTKQSTRAEDLLSSESSHSSVKEEESPEPDNDITERKPSDEIVFKSETSDNNKDVVPMEPAVDYKLANMEVLGRIEKIIAGFHTDVLQIASQSDRNSYKTLNKALRAMEAARALTQSAASKISKESDKSA
ncbi:hypothetical protein OESDEN_05935 [Oesophagostomum dentatum]|uniref:Uncharacterized protein n=1 Tax=Oesophagostomum dentatum TaxID=61180 RepID=A0A0B1TDJ0_OESDE|nr:hypothetical protein OESDEN_05935 [Oesophagostomum dentatum]